MPSIVLDTSDSQPSWSCPASQGRQVIEKQMNTRCERRGRKVKQGRGWGWWGVLFLMGGIKTGLSQEVTFKGLNEMREQASGVLEVACTGSREPVAPISSQLLVQ